MRTGNDLLSYKELARSLPPERRAGFLDFVQKGQASQEFLEYLETNRAAQVAIDTVMDRHGVSFENAAHLLKDENPPARTGLLSSIKDLFNQKLRKPFTYESKLTARLQDGTLADIPYAVSFSVADRAKYKSFKFPPEGHISARLHLLLRLEALKQTPASFVSSLGGICETSVMALQDHMLDRYGLKILDVSIRNADFSPALPGTGPVSASASATGQARSDNAANTLSNIRTLLEGLEKEVPVRKPLQLKKSPPRQG